MKRITSALALTLVAVLALAACGSGGSSPGGDDFNDADVAFAQQMIPHHEQAVEMAQIGRDNASSARVKSLAEQIESAQGPEIRTMKGWLEDWGKSEGGSMDMDHDETGDMAGMMSDADMSALRDATGSDFDRMFLTMMIAHHEGAIEMAEKERSEGQDADAKALAGDVVTTQTDELAEMKAILGA